MRQNFIDVLVLELNSYPKLLPVDINNYLSRIIGRNIKQNSLYICLYTPWILVIIYYQRTSHCKRAISAISKPPVLKLAAIVLLEPAGYASSSTDLIYLSFVWNGHIVSYRKAKYMFSYILILIVKIYFTYNNIRTYIQLIIMVKM